ncbi:MAG: NAD-dependent deacylase [Chloroflexi bacterium]|nr:MAG: NAD-dependent deacylase [Chloroflexota bacterium]
MTIPSELIETLRKARHVAVLTGAGISAESGVPTFREAQTGLWARYDPQELATPTAFQNNPKLVWEWYAWRRELVANAEPNPGHFALAEMEKQIPQFTLITQNVDSLHDRAGSQSIIALHGNISRIKCFDNNHKVDSWSETDEVPPRCPQCGSMLRPDVVWFGENLPYQAIQTAVSAAANCDLFFSIGTSSLVQPAASLPFTALDNRKPIAEINPQSTPITPYMTYQLTGPAGEILPRLVAATWPKT